MILAFQKVLLLRDTVPVVANSTLSPKDLKASKGVNNSKAHSHFQLKRTSAPTTATCSTTQLTGKNGAEQSLDKFATKVWEPLSQEGLFQTTNLNMFSGSPNQEATKTTDQPLPRAIFKTS